MQTIKLVRYPYESSKTIGVLEYNDFKCYTLELPWKDNASRISCIPEGEYEMVWRRTTKVSRGFTWGIKGGSVGLFSGGSRNNILIHSANYPSQLLGCIALGYTKMDSGVGVSRKAVDDFLNATVGKSLKLLIVGSGEGVAPPDDTQIAEQSEKYSAGQGGQLPGQSTNTFDPQTGGKTRTFSGTTSSYMPRLASTPDSSITQVSPWTNRLPTKEPWPRVLCVDSTDINGPTTEHLKNVGHAPQFNNVGEDGRRNIGIVEGDDTIERGRLWRR